MKRLLLAASPLVLVLAACGGAHRLPKGVGEIDVRAPVGRPTRSPSLPQIFSRRITDPAQVKSIVGWFDSLKRPGKSEIACAGGYSSDVTFTFRSLNGNELASANSPPARADDCNPIHLTLRGQQEAFLVDSGQGMALIGRIKRLFGPRFRPVIGYLG
jgi:hypothetical protein